jgi:hypothetical protein
MYSLGLLPLGSSPPRLLLPLGSYSPSALTPPRLLLPLGSYSPSALTPPSGHLLTTSLTCSTE